MKVALLHHRAVDRAGGVRQLLYLAHELIKLGLDVEVCFDRYDPDQAWPELTTGLSIRALRLVSDYRLPKPRSYMSLAVDQVLWGRMNSVVSADVSILNPHEWGALAALWSAGRHRPIVWMCNDPNSWDYVNSGLTVPPQGRTMSKPLARLAAEVERTFVTDKVDQVLCLDEQTRNLVEGGKGLRARVVRSGVDVSFFAPTANRMSLRASRGIARDDFVVLGVGILQRHRRFEDLLIAFAGLHLESARLVLIGSDRYDRAYAGELLKLSADLGLAPRFELITSPISDAELLLQYQRANVFVFPNEAQAWGLAVTEAMSVGLPVIVSTGAGVHAILTDGFDGLVVPPRRPDLIEARLRQVHDSAVLARELGNNARRTILAKLSWRAYALEMTKSFEETIRQRSAVRAWTHGRVGS